MLQQNNTSANKLPQHFCWRFKVIKLFKKGQGKHSLVENKRNKIEGKLLKIF